MFQFHVTQDTLLFNFANLFCLKEFSHSLFGKKLCNSYFLNVNFKFFLFACLTNPFHGVTICFLHIRLIIWKYLVGVSPVSLKVGKWLYFMVEILFHSSCCHVIFIYWNQCKYQKFPVELVFSEYTLDSVDGSRYSRMDQVKFFKGCHPQILLGLFLNTLTQMIRYNLFSSTWNNWSPIKYLSPVSNISSYQRKWLPLP